MLELKTVEKIFPNWREYPSNSMTPATGEFPDGNRVFFLIKGEEDLIQDFRMEPPGGRVIIETLLYQERSEFGEGKDVVIRFDFFFATGHPRFETVLYHDVDCSDLAQLLSVVKEVYVMVITNSGECVRAKKITWYPEKHHKILKTIGGM